MPRQMSHLCDLCHVPLPADRQCLQQSVHYTFSLIRLRLSQTASLAARPFSIRFSGALRTWAYITASPPQLQQAASAQLDVARRDAVGQQLVPGPCST